MASGRPETNDEIIVQGDGNHDPSQTLAAASGPSSSSHRNMQTRRSQTSNQQGDFVTALQAIRNTIQGMSGKAAGRGEALEQVDELLVKMRKYAATQEAVTLLADIETRIQTKVEQHFQALHTAIAAKTWAQIAATPPPAPTKPKVSEEKRRELEQVRKQRSQYEITLTAVASPTEVKEAIKSCNPKDVTEMFQQAITSASLPGDPRLNGVNRLGANAIRLQFKTREGAKTVRESTAVEWNKAYPGVMIHKPKYGVVVHGVKMEAIDLEGDHDETLHEWECQNAGRGIAITRVTPLRRNEKHRPTASRSLVIFTESQEAANECIKLGFFIDHHKHNTERYAPHLHINQCFRCHGYGHRASQCKRKEKCGRCSEENHATVDCKATEPKCTNCKGNHAAWHAECSARTEESTRLAQKRMDAPHLFP